MTTAHRFSAGWHRWRPAMALGAAGLLALGLVGAGCGNDDLAGTGLTASEATLGAEFAVDVPTLVELTSRLNLSAEQAGQMDGILAAWRNEAGERMAQRAERRAAHRAGEKGGRQRMQRVEAPGFDHLADAAAVLDNEQLDAFATYIEERRASRRADRMANRATDDASSVGPMAKRFAERLGVSDEEMTKVRSVHRESAEKMQDLHSRYAAGTLSAEELRDGLRAVRVETENRMKETVGEDDFARMHERRGAMKERALERRSENLEMRVARQVELLGKALRLDEAGKVQLASAMDQTLPARRQLIEQMTNDGLAPEEVLYQGIQIEKSASAAIRAGLSPEEAVRFDTIRRLLPAGGARGAGLGHGGPGFHHGGHH